MHEVKCLSWLHFYQSSATAVNIVDAGSIKLCSIVIDAFLPTTALCIQV